MIKLAALALVAGGMTQALAGDGATMKCADAKCAFPPTMVILGGGFMFESASGYCTSCKKFQTVSWTRPNLGDGPKPQKIVPEPKPLATVWVPTLGAARRVYKCPGCEGAFLEVRTHDELKHCPACSKPGFGVDPTAPRLAVD
jgi:hypothetical protein